MSYDFLLRLPEPGRDPLEIALSDTEEREPRPEDAARNLRVARALRAEHPGLFPEGEDAGAVDGERELSDATSGLQISLQGDEAALTVPYWHEGEAARRVLIVARSCLAVMVREGGYFAYDPQVGAVANPTVESEFPGLLAAYEFGVRRSRLPAAVPVAPQGGLFPSCLGRAAYLLRWTGSLLLAGGMMYALVRLTAGTPREILAVVPLPAWFVFKLMVLDPARLRDMGREPRGTFLSLLGPVAVYMQLWLFFGASAARTAAAHPAVGAGPAGRDDDAPVAGQLYPHLVPAEYLRYGKAGPESLSWPVGHGLHLELCFDLGGLVRNALSTDLARLGLTGEVARKRALENLDRLLASGRVRKTTHATPEGDQYVVIDGHWTAATALFWPGLEGCGEALPGSGPLLAGVPHRDALCLFRGGDDGRVGRMRALIREQRNRGRKPLADALFEITPGGVREIEG